MPFTRIPVPPRTVRGVDVTLRVRQFPTTGQAFSGNEYVEVPGLGSIPIRIRS